MRQVLRRLACRALIASLVLLVCGCSTSQQVRLPHKTSRYPPASATAAPVSTAPVPQFVQQNFGASHVRHFVSSDPPNNALLDAPPQNITLHFSCDLGSGSFMSVLLDKREMVTGPMITARDNRSLSAPFNRNAPSGNYLVKYTTYWCDGSYFDGSYGFSILRKDS